MCFIGWNGLYIFQTGRAEDIGIKGNNIEQFQLDKSKVMKHKFLFKTITFTYNKTILFHFHSTIIILNEILHYKNGLHDQ